MKSTGVVRQIDPLGRIVLPIEMRNVLGIEKKDALEIFVDGDNIILKKYQPSCIFCNESEDVISFSDKLVCRKCLQELKEKA
jgi:transcriptional pleiotropic regulator of transition state genes